MLDLRRLRLLRELDRRGTIAAVATALHYAPSGDAEAASAAMHRHITHAGELLADHLAERGLWRAT